MINNLEEQVKLLIELQGLDTHIFRLEEELELIPRKKQGMDEEFKAHTNGLKSLEDGLKALSVKRNEKEVELETKETTIKKYQTQMYQVKTNKEYTAFQEEIGKVKADISLIEEDIIKILDEIDAENRKITKEKDLLKQEESKLSEKKKALDEDGLRAKSELDGLKTQRETLVAKVEPVVRKKYDRIIKSKKGLAVVAVVNDACQGCFRVMPPQVINEIKMKTNLILCENCSRILYIEE